MRRPSLAAPLLAAALALGLAACTAQDPPSPTEPSGGAPEEPSAKPETGPGGGADAGEAPVAPTAPASVLEDPELRRKGKLGLSIAAKKCILCHKVEGKGGVLFGPLEQVTAERFVKMRAYDEHIAKLKAEDPARYGASKEIFDAIAAEEDRHRKVMRWLEAYLEVPTFDNGQAKMLKQNLTSEEIEYLVAWLVTLEPEEPAGGAADPAPPPSSGR